MWHSDIKHGLRWLWPAVVAAGITGYSAAAPGQSLESAAVEARRMARCLEANDTDCVDQLIHPYSRDKYSPGRTRFSSLRTLSNQYATIVAEDADKLHYFRLQVGQPSAIEADDDHQYALVPYKLIGRTDWWYEREGFWIGVYGDDTQGWQFIEDTSVPGSKVEKAIPDFQGPPLPEMIGIRYMGPRPYSSRYLVTEDAAFSIRDGEWNGNYELSLSVRKRIKEPMPMVIVYENPQDPSGPYIVPWLLSEGQEQLRLVSPLITGLRKRQIYNVLVIGYDAESEEIVFEHRQPMLFFPVADHEDLPLPAMMESRPISSAATSYVVGSRLNTLPNVCLDPQCIAPVPANVLFRIHLTGP